MRPLAFIDVETTGLSPPNRLTILVGSEVISELIGSRRALQLRPTRATRATQKKSASASSGTRRTRSENDPALTYFRTEHYHRPWLLDCRVRNGNGYFQPGMGTGSRIGGTGAAAEPTSDTPRRVSRSVSASRAEGASLAACRRLLATLCGWCFAERRGQ